MNFALRRARARLQTTVPTLHGLFERVGAAAKEEAAISIGIVLNSPDLAEAVAFARMRARADHAVMPKCKWELGALRSQAESLIALGSVIQSSQVVLAADGAAEALLALHECGDRDGMLFAATAQLADLDSKQRPETSTKPPGSPAERMEYVHPGSSLSSSWLPNVVIGDFDSLSSRARERLLAMNAASSEQLLRKEASGAGASAAVEPHLILCRSESQDENDLFKCIAVALACGEHALPGAGARSTDVDAPSKSEHAGTAPSQGSLSREPAKLIQDSATGSESTAASAAVLPSTSKAIPVDELLEAILRRWDTARAHSSDCANS